MVYFQLTTRFTWLLQNNLLMKVTRSIHHSQSSYKSSAEQVDKTLINDKVNLSYVS